MVREQEKGNASWGEAARNLCKDSTRFPQN
jgi:hypothetical protein